MVRNSGWRRSAGRICAYSEFRAEFLQGTGDAVGTAGAAEAAAVEVGGHGELVLTACRHQGGEFELQFNGVFLGGEAEAAAYPAEMGIHDDSRMLVDVGADNVGALAAYAGQGGEMFHGFGHPAGEFFGDDSGGGDEVPGLLPEEAQRMDQRFEFSGVGGGQIARGGPALEEFGSDGVHGGVGGLRRKGDGDAELERGAVVEQRTDVRMGGGQKGHDGVQAGVRGHSPIYIAG